MRTAWSCLVTATVSAVPEPQAYLMLAFGLLGVAAAVRRRSARASRR